MLQVITVSLALLPCPILSVIHVYYNLKHLILSGISCYKEGFQN